MSELLLSSALSKQFQTRFRQYLLFLDLLNDPTLLAILLDFLDVPELLRLAGTSKQLAPIVRIQCVEVRLLRAKLAYYEQPQVRQGINPLLLYLANPKVAPPQPKKMQDSYEELVKFNKQMRFYRYMKKEGVVSNKASLDSMMAAQGYRKFSTLENEFQKETDQLVRDLEDRPQLKNQWKYVTEQETRVFRKYKDLLEKGTLTLPSITSPIINRTHPEAPPKQSKPSKAPPKYLQTGRSHLRLQHEQARLDYQRRKMLKEQLENDSFISYEKFRQMAEEDPCSREIFFKVYQDEKKKWQEENRKQLTMKRPAPAEKEVREGLVQRAIKGIRGLKGMLTWSS